MTEDRSESLRTRKWVVYSAMLLLYAVLIIRFFQVQILDRDKFLARSEENRIRRVIVPPPRGFMYDANGKLLVDNHASFSVSIVPYEVKKAGNIPDFLAINLAKDRAALERKIEQAGSGFNLVKLISQIDFPDLAVIEEQKLDIPGVVIQTEPQRFYPAGVGAAHLLGNIGEVTEQELEKMEEEDRYQAGDIVGKDGLERQYEKYLRGEKGINYRQVDALGREIESMNLELKDQPPVPGKDLILSLDLHLQQVAETQMEGQRGSVVFMNAQNGEVIVQVSKPDYDPNFFSREFTSTEWSQIAEDPGKILYNRPIAGEFPAGSTFKPVAVLAALNEGIVTEDYRRSCGGAFVLGSHVFHCFRGTVHGTLDMRSAIECSCNIYFYQLGIKIGFEAWSKYVQILGFGKPTGIDLPNEKGGVGPTNELMERLHGKNWTKGHLVNMVIGQGQVLVTPMQMARFATMIANSGRYYTPHLVRAVRDNQNGTIITMPVEEHRITTIKQHAWDVLREGMYNVVQGDRGTGRGSRIYGLDYCGKTGTAQNPHGKDHGWFIGWAPAENPQVAWAVIVEHGGTGGGAAAPVAKAVLQEIFKERILMATRQPDAASRRPAAANAPDSTVAASTGVSERSSVREYSDQQESVIYPVTAVTPRD